MADIFIPPKVSCDACHVVEDKVVSLKSGFYSMYTDPDHNSQNSVAYKLPKNWKSKWNEEKGRHFDLCPECDKKVSDQIRNAWDSILPSK